MLLSPGVGLSLKSYIHTVMPQFWEKILAGKNVPHPSVEHRPSILVNRQCLQHFVDTCISNRMTSIPIHCPIRIMHGSDDKINLNLIFTKVFIKKSSSSNAKCEKI
ncbi:hypothetical protein X798_05450 [Onchocerca flexuosa]|uniref:Uncharacterized protein n=1 Tax=Onchocerca flexuosa TaxID=387005 RepID=A0A238BS65_9BILA|nr:hypothetical protein X798_05450 [Onchocerca flexuosa]